MKRLGEKSGRLLTLLWRESLELRRDRFTLSVLFLIPVFQLILFSYIITTDFDHLPLGLLDRAHTRESRDLIRAIDSTGYFVTLPLRDLAEVHHMFSRERCRAALVIPAAFSEAMANNKEVRLGLLLDGSDTTLSTSTEGFLTAIATAFYARARLERTPLTERNLRPRATAVVTTTRRVLFNPTLSGTAFMIPGLLGLIPMFLTVLNTTLAVVRERDSGTFEQLLVTPVTPTEVVLGKILPFGVVAMLAVLLIIVVGWLLFAVVPAGSLVLLLAVTPIFLLIGLSIGLLISSIAHSSADAVERSVLIMVPQLMLSDAIFPLSLMARPFQIIGEVVPLTHYLRITRGIYLKGQGIDELWPEIAFLVGFLLFFLVRASRAIKKQAA
jgi:ABC-2 type transport system permease protein